jgi:methionine-rich copper-binding protein CopC
MKKYFGWALGVALALSTVSFGHAAAAADLVQCDPPVGATLTSAPAQLRCTFSEALDTGQSKIQVSDAAGHRVDRNDAHVDLNDPTHTQLVVSLDPSKMKDGTYTVAWRSVSSAHNDAASGAFSLIVGAGSASAAQPQIRIVSPVNNQIVPLGDVKVEITTAKPSPASYWQLSVDDKMVGKAEAGATSITTTITTSGPHTLKATLADAQNDNLASAAIVVTSAPETPSQSPFNLPWVAAVMAVFVVFVLVLLFVSLRIAHPPVE